MNNFLNAYIESRPTKTPLSFGVNTNIILSKIDLNSRLTSKGEKSPFNFFMTFSKVKNSKVVASTEYNFFKFDTKDLSKTEDNFNKQANKLLNIATSVYDGDIDSLEEALMAAGEEIYGDAERTPNDESDDVFIYASKTLAKKKKVTAKDIAKMVISLQDNLNNYYMHVLKDKLGIGNCPEFNLLSVMNSSGFLSLPYEAEVTSLEEGTLKLDTYYLDVKKKFETKEKPDSIAGGGTSEFAGNDLVLDVAGETEIDLETGSLSTLDNI